MKRLLLIGCLVGLVACEKDSQLPDLEYTKYIEEVPNPIAIDSIRTTPIDSTYCDLKVYMSMDRQAFELDWDLIGHVSCTLSYLGTEDHPDIITSVELDQEGRALLNPSDVFLLSTYDLTHEIVLENTRRSRKSEALRIKTPSY